jgi:hypothetical protein
MEISTDIIIRFVNKIQEEFTYCNKRNQNFNGGYGNGKSFGASNKAILLLSTFPRYRIGISRYSAKELSQSTMSTFFKCCPTELYNDAYGGRRNDRDGELRLINGSEVFWMHLDDYSEGDLRGKEFNSVITDQAEEISENIYQTLDARINRWDMAEIPEFLNKDLFSKNKFSGRPEPPCYNMLLFNPDITLHWIYRMFHPESSRVTDFCGPMEREERIGDYSGCYYYKHAAWFSAATADNPAVSDELKRAYLRKDQSWIDRFYWGKWGIAGGAIHYVSAQSIIEFNDKDTRPLVLKLLEVIQKDGIKYRSMDHGESAPTCILWFCYLSPSVIYKNYGVKSKGIHICYREYYQPGKIIKYHREMIKSLSGDEKYYGNYADPAIFHKDSEKYGGFWRTADDYTDLRGFTDPERLTAPPIHWTPADNNEMATRDAISELLQIDENTFDPITGLMGAPQIYFLKQHTVEYPHGCMQVIAQCQAARKKKIGNENGEDIYSDERADGPDHAYDPFRYYAIQPKVQNLPMEPKEIPQFSFNNHLRKVSPRRIYRLGYGRN